MAANKQLRLAVTKNNLTKVQSLLKDGSATVDADVLQLAVSRGHTAMLEVLLKTGHTPTTEEAAALLIAAVQSDSASTLQQLLQVLPPASLNGTVREWSPLMHAVKLGQLASVEAMIRAGAAADYRMPTTGGTALMVAVQYTHPGAVALILKAGAPVEARDSQGWTALKWAAQSGNTEIIGSLLDAGAVVEAAEGEGSALMVAAENLRAEAVELLVARGSPLEACDAQGWCATSIAAASGHARILRCLLEAGASILSRTHTSARTALMAAALGGHKPAVEQLLEHARTQLGAGLDEAAAAARVVEHVNERDAQGATALMLAAKNAHSQMVALLLEAGADGNAADSQGHGPLEYASKRGALDVVRALLGASPPPTSQLLARALPIAIKESHVALVRLLASHGAPLQPHLMRAAAAGGSEQLLVLLKAGAADDVDQASEAMMCASCAGHRGIVAQLLAAGASVLKTDRLHGRSALMLAAQYGHAPVVKVLLDAQAPANATDASGARPLQLAVRAGHAGVVEELLRHGAKLGPDADEGTASASDESHEALLREAADSSVRALLLSEIKRRALESELCSLEQAVASKRSKKQRKRDAMRAAKQGAEAEAEAEAEAGKPAAKAEQQADEEAAEEEEADVASASPAPATADEVAEPEAEVAKAEAEAGATQPDSPAPKAAEAAAPAALPFPISAALANEDDADEDGDAALDAGAVAAAALDDDDDDDEAARDEETFGSPMAGFVPPQDLVAAGGRVQAQSLDMEAIARQSLGFADSTEQSVEGLRQQVLQLQLRVAAEQQCVMREQHITARMWIEKSQAEEAAEALQQRCDELKTQLASWEAWNLAQRRQQRQRRQQAVQGWEREPELLLRHLLADHDWRGTPQAWPLEERRRLGRTLMAAANLLHADSPVRPPGL